MGFPRVDPAHADVTFSLKPPRSMGPDTFVRWDTGDDIKATLRGGAMTATQSGKE